MVDGLFGGWVAVGWAADGAGEGPAPPAGGVVGRAVAHQVGWSGCRGEIRPHSAWLTGLNGGPFSAGSQLGTLRMIGPMCGVLSPRLPGGYFPLDQHE